jgi:hypothetical protein
MTFANWLEAAGAQGGGLQRNSKRHTTQTANHNAILIACPKLMVVSRVCSPLHWTKLIEYSINSFLFVIFIWMQF